MSDPYQIECRIDIDAGHRVTQHGAQCRNLHGHRYGIIAVCRGVLMATGEQQGMVLDFGFLKEEMRREIHDACDHALMLWADDPLALNFIGDARFFADEVRTQITMHGYYRTETSLVGTLYLLDTVPTAENLAAHWYRRLQPRVTARSDGRAQLQQVKVFETPHCMAAYPA